jgi:hypothetical protein
MHGQQNTKRGIFPQLPQPAGVKLTEEEVTGIHALSEKQCQSQGISLEENISGWQEA